MDIYHIWCNLKPGVSDVTFAEDVDAFLGKLKADGQLATYRVTRCKLGLSPSDLGEFHILLEFDDLAQLDQAFSQAASRKDPIESFHHAVNSKVTDVRFALYRDFPDANRHRGEEKF